VSSTPISITHCRMCGEKLETPREQPNDPRFKDRFSSRRRRSGRVAIHPARVSDLSDALRTELLARQEQISARRDRYLQQKEESAAQL